MLWLSDAGHAGFQPAPGVDGSPVANLLDPDHNTIEGYHNAAAEYGAGRETIGSLDTWMADRTRTN